MWWEEYYGEFKGRKNVEKTQSRSVKVGEPAIMDVQQFAPSFRDEQLKKPTMLCEAGLFPCRAVRWGKATQGRHCLTGTCFSELLGYVPEDVAYQCAE